MSNQVDTLLLALSGYFGMDCDLKWTGEFLRNVGSKIGIKYANRIKGWRLNGYIPDQSIQKILRLDIPDNLKALALKSRRSIAPGLSAWNVYSKKFQSTVCFRQGQSRVSKPALEKVCLKEGRS